MFVATGEYKRPQNGMGGVVILDPCINLPEIYNKQAIKKDSLAATIAATANKVYEVALASQDGTNQVAALEISVWKNDYSAPTGANADFKIHLHRENTTDGQDSTTTAVDQACSIGGVARIVCPLLDWATTKVMLKFSATASYQVSARALYYTP
jgi:hypothetical protein